MGRPTAAVVLEGTLIEQFDADLMMLGVFKPGAVDAMKTLAETHTILIVSAFAKTDKGVRILQGVLRGEGVPYDDIWMGWGLPSADVWYHDRALTLVKHEPRH